MVADREIRLRPSLVKFDSNLTDLNVVRVSYLDLSYASPVAELSDREVPRGLPQPPIYQYHGRQWDP